MNKYISRYFYPIENNVFHYPLKFHTNKKLGLYTRKCKYLHHYK